MPQLRLLSKPGIFLDDAWQPLPKGKTSAFLYYLAYQGDWVSRDELVYLFWPDTSETQARSNLRSLLSRSIGKLSYVTLETEREKIRWQVESDFASYQKSLSVGNHLQVIESYTGELLSGYSCNDAPEFEHWLELERQEVFEGFKAFAQAQVDNFMIEKNYQDVARILKAVLGQDPFDELTFRQYLKAVYLSEGQPKAEQVFADYKKALSKEFDAEPEERTFALFDELNSAATQTTTVVAVKTQDKALHNLPIKLTPFVGRKKERDEIAALLADPVVRLLTIVAPGGMGKTRLAISSAEEHIGSFADGIWFIAFETLENPDNFVFHIAEGLDFKFFGQDDPKEQLFNYLKEKEMLLVTDNLEHILEGVTFISQLLEHSPATKVLATSREILDLHAEHVYELSGLNLDEEQAEESEAVRLFVQSVQQRDKAFEFRPENADAVTLICELVAGMPLALELAASWLRVLSLEDVVEELKESIDILESQTRDRPDRQQSIRTIFDYSWSLLSKQEQAALSKLAVFHGGFDRKSAKEVTQTSVPILLGLCNKSFIRKEQNGRYTQHPLMWQYVREKFKKLEDSKDIKQQHAAFFANFLYEREWALQGLDSVRIQGEIDDELANILDAWDWLLTEQNQDLLLKSLWALSEFYRNEYRVDEAIDFYQKSLERTNPNSILYARLLHRLGFTLGNKGDFEASYEALHKSLEICQKLSLSWDKAQVLYLLGFARESHKLKSIEELIEIHQDSAVIFRSENDTYYEARVLFHYSQLLSKPLEEIKINEQCIESFRKTKGYFGLSLALDNLARNYFTHLGRLDDARNILDEKITIDVKRKNTFGLYQAWQTKAKIESFIGSYEKAKELLNMTIELCENHKTSQGSLDPAYPIFQLAEITYTQEDYYNAKKLLIASYNLIDSKLKKENLYFLMLEAKLCLEERQFDETKILIKEVNAVLGNNLSTHDLVNNKIDVLILQAKLNSLEQKFEDCLRNIQKVLQITIEYFLTLKQARVILVFGEFLHSIGKLDEAKLIYSFLVTYQYAEYNVKVKSETWLETQNCESTESKQTFEDICEQISSYKI